jgi:signal transduction histidine kinase
MLVIAALLAWQINRLLEVSSLVAHSDEVIAGAYEAEKLAVDLETGLRGYMVTGEAEFLQPYRQALQASDQTMARLGELVADTPPQRQALEEITSLHQQWLAYAQQQIAIKEKGGDVSAASEARRGKVVMDAMRQRFIAFIAREVHIRDQRESEVGLASKTTLALTAGMALLGGGLLGFLSRRQFMSLGRTYEQALQTANDLNATLEHRVADRTNELLLRSEQLVDANEELEAFAYSISHDLRAPMRHVTGFVNLLHKSVDEKLSPVEQEYLETIDATAKLAGQMVDDLLAFSRVGRVQLHVSTVDLNALVAQCRRDLEPETRGREIDWRVEDLPAAQGDPALLKLAFLNLLSNAVKYTGKQDQARIEVGTVIAGEAEGANATAGSVVYFVRDNGVGFDMEYGGKLFGVFQRLHRAEEFEGTGIGLANVRRIIVRHGGRIWADATLGRGATFYFTLPNDVNEAVGESHGSDQANSVG